MFFLKAVQTNMKQFLQYRNSFLISIAIHPFILLLNIFLYRSIFAHNGAEQIKGYTLTEMIWYTAGITFVWIFIWNFAERRISDYVVTGDLSIHLLKPINIFWYELSAAVALRMTGILLEFVPDIIVYSVIYPPSFLTALSLAKFVIVCVLSFCLFFLINYLIGMTAFALKSNSGLNEFVYISMNLLGGGLLPLDFYPAWLQRICDFLPFKYIFYYPIQIFLNKESVNSWNEWGSIVLTQLAWIAGGYLLCHVLWKLAIRKFCAVGG
ncbi:ABC transporter permease [Cohnella mopanensis]|uniref:ABC transporter permease n=1 Tax=Cohnella mopanensis TaxID=2911966 RepID=UPI001EF7805A|nr:ABC-2 family transporter protein [Cohnella mopanensis]